jgi:hypothetical protein
MLRFIILTAYTLGIMEMIFIAIVLLGISLPSPKNILHFPHAGSAQQQVSLMEKDHPASSSETVVWLNTKDNNP